MQAGFGRAQGTKPFSNIEKQVIMWFLIVLSIGV
jgi:hypothetical protein